MTRSLTTRADWPFTLLAGLLTGVAWTLLSTVMLVLIGDGFLFALPRSTYTLGTAGGLWLFVSGLAAAIWTIWLYTALRSRYGPGARAALIAALSWWLIASLQSSKWITLLHMEPAPAFPLIPATLVVTVAATLPGAWVWERSKASRSR